MQQAAPVKTPAQVAAQFGCTVEQAREQLVANAKQMASMAEKAVAAGGKFRGFTADYLQERAAAFASAAAA